MSVAVAQVSAADRFGFTLFLALAMHALLVFGVSIAFEDPEPASRTLEITLSQFDDKDRPEKADFFAQTNQQGSGDQAEKAQLSNPKPSEMPDVSVQETALPVLARQSMSQRVSENKPVVSTVQARQQVTRVIEPEPDQDAPPARNASLMQRSLEIASLQARFDEQKRAYAKRPKVTRLTAASTMSTADAYYMKQWRDKIERIGTINYPLQAKKNDIKGMVRMLVALYPDGSVKEIKVLQSSGHKILDDAAIRTVRLSEPFAPFTEEMRQDRDILEIIRTWSYQGTGLLNY